MRFGEAAEMLLNIKTKAEAQRGITGLETAIILIAFVVVASVFAFTVLSTGIFASERSKETVFKGLEEAKSSIEPRGSVIAYKANRGGTDTIYKISWVVSNAVAGEPVDLTPPYLEGNNGTDPDIDSGAEYKTVISYTDINQHMADVPWTVSWVGNSNGDNLLEEGEKAEITAWLLERTTTVAISDVSAAGYWVADGNGAHGILSSGTLIGTNDQFTLEMAPESGAVLTVQRTAPSRLDTIMDLK
jgi:archaeal flagellin FlaB